MSINRIVVQFFITISVIINICFPQSSTITGAIKDSRNSKPLVCANVFLKETSLGTATIDDGSYLIANIKPGNYILKATYIGYESKEIEIFIKRCKSNGSMHANSIKILI